LEIATCGGDHPAPSNDTKYLDWSGFESEGQYLALYYPYFLL
jgi:hypothetical protein